MSFCMSVCLSVCLPVCMVCMVWSSLVWSSLVWLVCLLKAAGMQGSRDGGMCFPCCGPEPSRSGDLSDEGGCRNDLV